MHLDIHVTFTAGHYHGWEWPPAPARLFQALVAGTHRGAHGLIQTEVRDRALRWLEKCEPPTIFAPPTQPARELITGYVPNNDDGASKDLREHIKAAKSMRLHPLPAECRITYRWEVDREIDAERNADVVSAMASLVTWLGRTVDFVYARGEVGAESSGSDAETRPAWLPRERPGGHWLAPANGFLAWCHDRYPRSVSDVPPDMTNSRQVDYSPAAQEGEEVPLALLELVRLDGSLLRFDPRSLREASGMVRHAFTCWLEENPRMQEYYGGDRTARLLLGHQSADESGPAQHGHFGIVPLPSMNDDFTADGDLRRVLVIGWGVRDEDDRALFQDLIRGLDGMALEDSGRIVGALRAASTDTSHNTIRRWRTHGGEPARTWRTVTPIILTGHARRSRSPEMCLVRALRQQGVATESIETLATYAGPIVPKCPPAPQFRVAGYLATTRRVHAEIIFRVPIKGPLIVGRGRFAGFGLMIPS